MLGAVHAFDQIGQRYRARGRVADVHHLFGEMSRLDQKIDALGGALSARIDALEQKFDRRFDALDQKFDRRFEAVDRQFIDLRAELSKQFRWTFSTMLALLGMMLTVGAGVATALLRN